MERTKLQLFAWKIPENRKKGNSRTGSEKMVRRKITRPKLNRDRGEGHEQYFIFQPDEFKYLDFSINKTICRFRIAYRKLMLVGKKPQSLGECSWNVHVPF